MPWQALLFCIAASASKQIAANNLSTHHTQSTTYQRLQSDDYSFCIKAPIKPSIPFSTSKKEKSTKIQPSLSTAKTESVTPLKYG